jgi:hypothetical protein
MNKKILYLFLALALPIVVFLFLKYFGKNEFDIPVYYEKGVADSLTSKCGVKINRPYVVPESALANLKWSDSVTLVADVDEVELKALNQLMEEKGFTDLRVLVLPGFLQANKLTEFKECILFMRKPWNVVLVDEQKRIRGYYKIGYRDEMDRLDVELKILLKKY